MAKRFIFFITIREEFDEFDEKTILMKTTNETKRNRSSSTKEPDRKTHYFD